MTDLFRRNRSALPEHQLSGLLSYPFLRAGWLSQLAL